MKYTFAFLALLIFSFGCDPSDTDTLPDETIELDNATWNYSQKYSLVQFGGTPARRDIHVKIDGEDGSYLYLTLPQEYLDSIPSMPYEVNGRVAYYSNSSIPIDVYLDGPATIQLLGIDANTQQLQLAFDATVRGVVTVGHNNVEKHFRSGVISIDFKELKASATVIDFEIKRDQAVWHISEMGSHMTNGQVRWFYYSDEAIPEASGINLYIPWGQALGTFHIDSTMFSILYYEQGSKSWTLESAELTVEENSFRDAKQKGSFKAVFHRPDFPDQKFEVTEGRFAVSF
ncbi:MAG: hypothetical protein H7246_16230 [Phycisphaerae bacterium]|nr:hypothetical protein [Saprospiraceae bacterium]